MSSSYKVLYYGILTSLSCRFLKICKYMLEYTFNSNFDKEHTHTHTLVPSNCHTMQFEFNHKL